MSDKNTKGAGRCETRHFIDQDPQDAQCEHIFFCFTFTGVFLGWDFIIDLFHIEESVSKQEEERRTNVKFCRLYAPPAVWGYNPGHI